MFLGEAVLRLLRVLSPTAGCLLVLEDLHWADGETLALLEYLADNLAAERVLCVGTLRDEDGGAAAGLASTLEGRGSAAVMPLGRLDRAAMARMALACVGAADLPGAVQSLVAERAEGLPFLIEEVLAGLIGEGALAERDGSWQATALAGTGVPARSPMRCCGAWTGWTRIRAGSFAPLRCWAGVSTGHCWARSRAWPTRLWSRRCGGEWACSSSRPTVRASGSGMR